MAENIATLGIKVTSSGVKETSENLEKVSKSSEKAQKAIDKLLESYKQQEVKARSGKAGLAEYRLSLLGATEAEKKFAVETIKSTEALNKINSAAQKNTDSMSNLLSVLAKIAPIYALYRGLKGIASDMVSVSVAADSMKISLNAALGGVNAGSQAMEFLRKESERLGLVLNDQIKGFTGLAAAARGTALEGEKTREIYTAIVESGTALHKSSTDIEGTLLAVQQIMSKGKVQSEELRRQLGDRLPGAFQIAARAMNVSTSELSKMLEQGQVLSDDFLPKFAKALREQYSGSINEASQSIQANINRMDTAWFELRKSLYSAFEPEIRNIIKETTEFIKDFSNKVNDPATKEGLKDLAELMSGLSSAFFWVAKKGTEALKVLSAASVASEAATLSEKGLIDILAFSKASFDERAIMVEKAKKAAGGYKIEIDKTTEGYKKFIEATEKVNAKTKENIVLSKDQIKAKKEAESKEKQRVKFIEDYIAKLEQEADTYKKGKEYTADYVLSLKDATDAQKQRAKIAGAFIDEAKRLDESEKKNKKNLEDYAAVMKKVMPEFERDELSRQQALELTATIFKDKLTPAMMGTAAALHLFDEQSEAVKNINEYFDTKEIDDFTKKTDDLKDKLKFEGTSFGNEIADGINNAVISMQKFNDQLDKQTKYQKDIDKLQKEIDQTSNLDLKAKKQKEMDDLAQEGIKGQLSAYRQLFGTTSQLFKENSKERKALHNLEMAFAMAEIAMNLQKTISAAYTAIMIQGTGDPYSAFGRIAAMTALAGGIVAAAGGSLSGGGSASAPTAVSGASQSTALGSTEQSQSITNAFSFLEDIESGQYSELKDISASMKDLNKNITGLVTSIVRTGGVSEFEGVAGTSGGTSLTQDVAVKYGISLGTAVVSDIAASITKNIPIIGNIYSGLTGFIDDITSSISSALFGGSKKTSILSSGLQITPGTIGSGEVSTQAYADIKVKKEGGLFGSDKTYFKTLTDEVDQSVQDMITIVFKNMGETMVDIAKGLGTENLEEVFNYVFDIGKIDLKGLDTEGLNKALQEAFSTTADKAVTDLFGELIGRYQKIGEGILETAVRLVGEKAVIMDVLELTNQGFEGSDIPAKALEVTQALVDMAGGLDSLTDAATTYYDKFFTEAEKQVRLQNQLTESLGSVGLELPKTRDSYRAIVESLDLTTEAGQKTYVSLLGLSEGADKYYTSLENGNKVLAENQKNILSINSDIERSIAQMDMTPLEKSIDDITRSTAATIQKLIDLGATEDQLTSARLYGERQINATIEAERKNIEAQEKANQKLYDNKYVELLEAQGKSTEALNLKRKLELESLDDSVKEIQLRIWKLNDETAANTKAKEAIQSLIDKRKEEIKAAQDTQEAIITKLANDTNQIQLDLLQAQGRATQALNLQRAIEIKELSDSLVPLKQQIYALQDKRKLDEMQVQILELEGKHIESVVLQRKLEFESLTDSEKILQNRIWKLQDEKAKQEEIAKTTDYLNDVAAKTVEILVLEGKTVEATAISRQIELSAMEEGLRPLQLRIWALEDAKKAEEESLRVVEERIRKENSKNNMLITLLELEGNASEALKIKRMLEINAMDDSLKPMQQRIWALQDQVVKEQEIKAIADKRNELNIRQLKALGKEEQALAFERTLELNAIDETLRAKQINIWMLEDEKEAQEKANAILKEKANLELEISKEKADLELEILKLTLSETEYLTISRQKELESVDKSNIALKERIFQLTDEQAAIEKAKELSLKKQSLEIEYLKIAGKETEALRLQRSLDLLGMDDSLKSLQERNWALQDEKDALEKANQIARDISEKEIEIAEKKRDLLISLMMAEGKTAEAIAAQRLIELNALDDSLKPIQKKIWLLEDEKKAQEEAVAAIEKANEERKNLLEKQLSDSEDMLKKSIDKQISFYQTLADEANKKLEEAKTLLDRSFVAEQESITKKHESLIEELTNRLNEAQDAASGLENVFNSLSEARKSLEGASNGVTYKTVQKQLIDALTMAKTGDMSMTRELIPNLGVLTSQNNESYKSEQDFKRDFFKTYNALSELEKISGTQLTEQQQIIKNLELQTQQENTNYQATMDALQAQYDAVIGVNNSVVSFEQAVLQYQQAQYAADGANALLKAQKETLENQLNTLLNINVNILSVSDAINNLAAAQAAMASFNAAQSVTVPAFADGGLHYGGLRLVGENGPEVEYTPPANITSNNDLKEMFDNTDVVRILREVKESIDRGNFAVAKNTGEAAKVLKKFDYDGMPEQRTA